MGFRLTAISDQCCFDAYEKLLRSRWIRQV